MKKVKPFKPCRVCKVTWCETGYCADCRARDATILSIKARERMDRRAAKRERAQ